MRPCSGLVVFCDGEVGGRLVGGESLVGLGLGVFVSSSRGSSSMIVSRLTRRADYVNCIPEIRYTRVSLPAR